MSLSTIGLSILITMPAVIGSSFLVDWCHRLWEGLSGKGLLGVAASILIGILWGNLIVISFMEDWLQVCVPAILIFITSGSIFFIGLLEAWINEPLPRDRLIPGNELEEEFFSRRKPASGLD